MNEVKLQELTEAWKEAKRNEQEWNQRRTAIESEIYQLTERTLPDKGTTTLLTGMKVVTGFSEEWDQEKLNDAYNQWQAPLPFPFKGQWKPDGKQIGYVRDNCPELYRLLQPALTLKPKKPAFSLAA